MRTRKSLLSGAVLLLFFSNACTVVENIHEYFNQPLKIVSAKRTDYFDVVAVYSGERLSDIAQKLTGTQSTRYLRSANPTLRSDVLTKGTVVHVPTGLLKPGLRASSRALAIAFDTPIPEISRPAQKETKDYKKLKLPRGKEVEILPNGTAQDETDDTYDTTPFKLPEKKIIPYSPPKPTPDKAQAEEERLRDKYKDIMKQLEQ